MQQHNPARFLDALDTQAVTLLLAQREENLALPEWLTAGLPNATLIQFPNLASKLLWPFHARDPRNHPEEGHKHGRYPYGDTMVIDLLAKGLRGAALFDHYIRQSQETLKATLGSLRRNEEQRLHQLESSLDIHIADSIWSELPGRKLFHTYDHPTGWLFLQLAARIIDALQARLNLPAVRLDPDNFAGQFEPLASEQVPIHPVIPRTLQLAWWQPGQTYRQPNGTMLNFRQYIRRYIDFT